MGACARAQVKICSSVLQVRAPFRNETSICKSCGFARAKIRIAKMKNVKVGEENVGSGMIGGNDWRKNPFDRMAIFGLG